jgi:hypothetical protein
MGIIILILSAIYAPILSVVSSLLITAIIHFKKRTTQPNHSPLSSFFPIFLLSLPVWFVIVFVVGILGFSGNKAAANFFSLGGGIIQFAVKLFLS